MVNFLIGSNYHFLAEIFFWIGVTTAILCCFGVGTKLIYRLVNYVFETWIDLRDFARIIKYAEGQGINLFKRK